MGPTNDTQNKSKRHWYQFSLRTLLIVVTLSALPLAWVGSKVAQARKKRAAITWIEELGGEGFFYNPSVTVSWIEQIDEWFGMIKKEGCL